MIKPEGQTSVTSNDEDKYEEEWKVILNTKGVYTLSKMQAMGLKQEIASGNRGIVLFQTFSIPIPYITEFYRSRRFLKDTYALPVTATEEEYIPIPPEKWKELKEKMSKIGLPIAK